MIFVDLCFWTYGGVENWEKAWIRSNYYYGLVELEARLVITVTTEIYSSSS